MTCHLEIAPHARRSLDKIPPSDFREIEKSILALQENPRPHGVTKLKGAIHRIRVGHWRIIYLISDREKRIAILDVVRRSESTYKHY